MLTPSSVVRLAMARVTPPARWSAALSVAALAAGCASSDPAPTRTASVVPPPAPGTFTASVDYDGFEKMGYRLAWTGSAVVSRGQRVQRADVFGDGVVVLETGHAVSFVQADDGRTRWSTALGNNLTRFVGNARHGDRVYVASDIELFVLSAQTGDLLDKHPLAVVVDTPPVVADGAVFFGSPIGRVLAHDLRTGLERWQYQLEGPISAPPVLVGENVGVVSETGDVIVLDPERGTATMRAGVYGAPGGAPAGEDNVLAFACMDQSAYAFNSRGGSRLWRYRTETSLDLPLTIFDGLAHFAVPGRGMVALDLLTGEEVWTAAGIEGKALGTADGLVLVWDGMALHAIDERGELVSTVDLPSAHRIMMPDPHGGELYIVTDHGAVARFSRI